MRNPPVPTFSSKLLFVLSDNVLQTYTKPLRVHRLSAKQTRRPPSRMTTRIAAGSRWKNSRSPWLLPILFLSQPSPARTELSTPRTISHTLSSNAAPLGLGMTMLPLLPSHLLPIQALLAYQLILLLNQSLLPMHHSLLGLEHNASAHQLHPTTPRRPALSERSAAYPPSMATGLPFGRACSSLACTSSVLARQVPPPCRR
jgi:hypothetical protein